MKKLIAGVLALGLSTVSTMAMAANYYQVECLGAACKPFTKDNSYVLSLAVSTAQSNGAMVGDSISVFYVPPPGGLCEERIITFTVKNTPVYNSTQLTHYGNLCIVNNM